VRDRQDTKTLRQRARREAFLERFRPYVRERLLPRMGLSPDGFALSVPRFGERSMLFMLSVGEREMVVRTYPRRSDRVRTVRAMRHALRHGVKVPALVHQDRSLATRRRYGCSVLVEERVPGRHFHEADDRRAALGLLARAVSGMHNVYRSRWGNLAIGRRGGYLDRQIGVFQKHLERSRRSGLDFPASEEERVLDWLRRYRADFAGIRRFSLTHRSVAADNVLITPAGELCFIDVQRLGYEHFAANLVKCLALFGDSREEEDRFLAQYFRAAEGRGAEEFERFRAPFRMLHVGRVLSYALAKGQGEHAAALVREIRETTGE
jgi:hypothetical protein